MVVSNIFYFHPYLGKISNLTNVFQMGWNHQPDIIYSNHYCNHSLSEGWRPGDFQVHSCDVLSDALSTSPLEGTLSGELPTSDKMFLGSFATASCAHFKNLTIATPAILRWFLQMENLQFWGTEILTCNSLFHSPLKCVFSNVSKGILLLQWWKFPRWDAMAKKTPHFLF